jgi:predicted nucleic acid-binding protein
LKDKADNFLIELTLASNALKIITNNIRGLENAELSFPNLEILTPEIFLQGK